MKMHRLVFLGVVIVIFGLANNVSGMDCELKNRLNRAIREMPVIEEIKAKTQRSLHDVVENLRSNYQQRKRQIHQPEPGLPQLMKNVESFLGRIIPNSGLVQDLMGYITMPRYITNGSLRL